MKGQFGILVVDDDRLSRVSTVKHLRSHGHVAEWADNGYKALQMLEDPVWKVVVTDLRMPGMDGLELLREVRKRRPDVDVFLMTAYATAETAVAAMHEGATDYMVKPFDLTELELRLQRLHEMWKTRRELELLRRTVGQPGESDGLLGRSAVMDVVRERIRRFADAEAPVLITGETGTGKELVARALHDCGPRSGGEFVALGCGTIPRDLAESELFGHERGAFTGATQTRRGSFERADEGTLLLDDVDDLALDLQVKLLRVLQEGTFVRVGGSRETTVGVRVVATTKVDLERAAADGSFRPDLFYRLRGLEIRLPPLRDRGEDVLLLADHFLSLSAAARDREPRRLSPEAARVLLAYPWPGNVRELRRAVESADVIAPDGEIQIDHLPEFLHRTETDHELFSLRLDGRDSLPFTAVVGAFEGQLIRWAMTRAGGNQAEAARILGLPRTTLQSKLPSDDHPAREPDADRP